MKSPSSRQSQICRIIARASPHRFDPSPYGPAVVRRLAYAIATADTPSRTRKYIRDHKAV